MRIAFDRDNTLIRGKYAFALETPRRRFWARLLGKEALRAGTVELAECCRQRGWEIWVYTTSYRGVGYIRRLFWLHGIRLAGVVNQARHDREVTVRSTKYPPRYGIDLLLDDSEGVRLEGERHGFAVLVTDPTDVRPLGMPRCVLERQRRPLRRLRPRRAGRAARPAVAGRPRADSYQNPRARLHQGPGFPGSGHPGAVPQLPGPANRRPEVLPWLRHPQPRCPGAGASLHQLRRGPDARPEILRRVRGQKLAKRAARRAASGNPAYISAYGFYQ